MAAIGEALAWPNRVVRFQSWGTTGLGATAGVAGEAAPDDQTANRLEKVRPRPRPLHQLTGEKYPA